MINRPRSSKALHITIWVAQILLAVILVLGTVIKFQPIEKASAMMPWTGQIPVLFVRLMGIVDLLGAIGIILPSLFRIKPRVTVWAALSIIALMVCATIFHILRGEASVIGFNIFVTVIAGFVAWGRQRYHVIPSRSRSELG